VIDWMAEGNYHLMSLSPFMFFVIVIFFVMAPAVKHANGLVHWWEGGKGGGGGRCGRRALLEPERPCSTTPGGSSGGGARLRAMTATLRLRLVSRSLAMSPATPQQGTQLHTSALVTYKGWYFHSFPCLTSAVPNRPADAPTQPG